MISVEVGMFRLAVLSSASILAQPTLVGQPFLIDCNISMITWTGIAYATPLGHNSALKDIDVVIDWGERMDSIEKIPSVISYSQRSRGIHEANWGSDLAPGAVAMKHMKLRLDPQDVSDEIHFLLQLLDGTRDLTFENIKDSKGMPDYTDRSPEEVVTDYLSNVADHVLQTVGRFTDQFRRTIPVDLVITIPVVRRHSYNPNHFR